MAAVSKLIAEIQELDHCPSVYLFNADDVYSLTSEQVSMVCTFFAGTNNAPHGYGEVVWIVDGQIMARDVLINTPSETVRGRLSMFNRS